MPSGMPHVTATVQEVYRNMTQVLGDVVASLELPSASEYWESFRVAARDVVSVTKSVCRVGYLTFRPLVLLLLLLMRLGWVVLKFFAIHLFGHTYVSTKHACRQFQVASMWFLQWQRSLSRAAIGIEVAILGLLAGCYMLRRYIQKKKFAERTTRWYRRRKLKVKMQYNRLVRRISRTSLLLAMSLPHAIFAGTAVVIRWLLPRFVTYIVRDTAATACLSLWYPFFCTVGLLHQWRGHLLLEKRRKEAPPTDDHHQQQQHEPQHPTAGTRTGLYPKTTPKPRRNKTRQSEESPMVKRWFKNAMTPGRRRMDASEIPSEIDLAESAEYWLKYWVVYALISASCRLLMLIPLVGRILSSSSALAGFLPEVELLFYLWVFLVPLVLVGDTTATLEFENRPLELVYERASPVAGTMFQYTSNAIPEAFWNTVVSKTRPVLEVLVMIKLLSAETKDRIVHIVQESAPFLPPGITLFMPGFITEFGVLYVKSVVPSAKAKRALVPRNSSAEEEHDSRTRNTMSMLEYWVLHCLLAMVLNWWSSILWWIPFSTHGTFCLWCLLQIPRTTASWYNMWEEELMAFGLLSRWDNDGEFELRVENTVTAGVLRFLSSRLPSGVEEDEQDEPQDTQVQADEGAPVETGDLNEQANASQEALEPVADDGSNGNETEKRVDHSVLPEATSATGQLSSDNKGVRRRRQRRAGNSSSEESASSGSSDGSQKLRRSTRRRRKPLHAVNVG